MSADAPTATRPTDLLDTALRYAELGYPVFPVEPRGKRPLGRLAPHGLRDATARPERIRQWWAAAPDANIGLAVPAGVLVLDVDGEAGRASVDGETLPSTPTAQTGRGAHYWYRLPDGATARNGAGLRPGLDVRALGGYVVAPPSVHPSGHRYAWAPGLALGEVPLAEAPDWLVALLRERTRPEGVEPTAPPADHAALSPYVEAALRDECARVASAPVGTRNSTLNAAAYALGQLVGAGALGELTAMAELESAAGACLLPMAEARATIRSGIAAGRAQRRDLSHLDTPRGGNGRKRAQEAAGAVGAAAGYPDTPDAAEDRPAAVADHCTDLAMADRLVARYAADLRFVPGRGWHFWDGRRWAPDEALTVERLADETARAVWREVGQADGRAERDRLIRFATRACSRRGQEAMVALARHRPEVLAVRDTLDADPWLLNTLDGTVDLRTGELRPHDRGDLVTRLAPTAWDPAGGCAAWLAFLNRVLPDPAVRAYVARLIGYSITGLTSERVFVCCFGPTASGKSTFAATLRAVLGDYAGTVSVGALTRSPNACMDDERAAVEFDGPRLLFGSEAENGSRWRMNVLKRVAGGADEVTARPLHCETYRFRPQCTVWLMTNELPHADPGDGAFWARCQTIPFPVSIPEEER
ncbi:MAG TPA: phage/plasmid primase, P4 family, partial [Armatimonadota bacterium]|nr:phage/plasmid primase, P4 family [Armatimonadota bacterium]